MKRVYSLTDEECARIDEWSVNHDCRYRCGIKCHRTPIGGDMSITFTPTSMGTIVIVKCVCGKKLILREEQ